MPGHGPGAAPTTGDPERASAHAQALERVAPSVAVAPTQPEAFAHVPAGHVVLSVWGDLVWAEAGPGLLGERIWPPVDERVRLGPGFERSAAGCSVEERRQVNERLGDLARHLSEPQYNPRRLDFKPLKVRHGSWTHECDAWSKAGAKRLFGCFEGSIFVVDALTEGLH